MGSCCSLPPSMKLNCVLRRFEGELMLHSRRPPLPNVSRMAQLTFYVIFSRLLFAKLLSSKRRPDGLPILLVRWTILACFITHSAHLMTRPRGRPKGGSPWKPRRPPVSPPGSSSDLPSPRPRTVSPAALPQDSLAATTPRTPISLSSHLLDPLVKFHSPAPSLGSSGDPLPQGVPKRAALHSTGSFDRTRFRDRLLIMHDLVFELRQEMADLNYRLQATDEKVANCLHLLSSMQGDLTLEPVVDTPRKAPVVDTDAGLNTAQRPVNREPAKTEHGRRDKGIASDEADEPAYEPTYIEEEPWPGDLPPMWPAFSPGV